MIVTWYNSLMKLVVGLGNPGKEYENTRHNLGFRVVDELVNRVQGTGYSWEKNAKLKSEICNLKTETCNLLVAKPQTFMNNSGEAVNLLAAYYKLSVTDLIVVYDELDLSLGEIRVREGGSSAGHHGVQSIIEALGTDQFTRIRLGIGPASDSAERFVLESFTKDETQKVINMINEAVVAIDRRLLSPLD